MGGILIRDCRPISSLTGRWIELWWKFFLSLNWRVGRCRPWRGAGGAEAFTAPRAGNGAAGNARNREPRFLKAL